VSERPLIVHVIHHLHIGGMENGLVNLINRIPRDRYRHCVVCAEDFSDFRDRIQPRDVSVIAMHKSKLTRVQLYRRLLSLFRQLAPSIVHTRNLSGLDALLPAWRAGVPVRIHGEHGWDVDDLEGRQLRPWILRRLHSPLVDRYVAVSKHIENYMTRSLHISPSRITQIYNGADIERFAPSRGKPWGIMPETFYGEDKVVIGTVGRLQPVKDQHNLLQSFALLLRENTNFRDVLRLTVVGNGPQRDALMAQSAQQGISDVTWFAGARADVARFYHCFDVFALPSLNEGISNTLLEAMASGLPIVATAVGGNVELVDENVNGRLVRASDPHALKSALRSYASDAALRRAHGDASRLRVVTHFSVDSMVSAYVDLYDTMRRARVTNLARTKGGSAG